MGTTGGWCYLSGTDRFVVELIHIYLSLLRQHDEKGVNCRNNKFLIMRKERILPVLSVPFCDGVIKRINCRNNKF